MSHEFYIRRRFYYGHGCYRFFVSLKMEYNFQNPDNRDLAAD